MFDRLPAQFEQEALLWIKVLRFTGSNTKEGRIKLVDRYVQKTALTVIRLVGYIRIRIVIDICIPTADGHRSNSIGSVCEQMPISFRVVCAAGKTAAHAYDGDGFGREQLGLWP